MKLTKLFAAVMAIAAVATACQEPEAPVTPNQEGKAIAVSAQMYNFTKATDTAFEEGDAIGLHIVTDRTYLNNAKYTYTNGALVGATTNYWYEDEELEADVLAYYPYSTEGAYKAEGYTFAVKADQSTEGAYAASDLLIAATTSKPTAEAVVLPFKHALSKIVVKINNLSSEVIENVYLTNVYTAATFNLVEGTSEVSGEVATVKTASVTAGEEQVWTVILVPQADATPSIVVTTESDRQFTFNIAQATTLSAGKVATANLTIAKDLVATEFSAEISDWESDGDLEFNPSEDNTDNGDNGEGNEGTEPEVGVAHKIYVYNYVEWGTVNLYAWDEAGTPMTGSWPGTEIVETEEINGYTYLVYTMSTELDGAELGIIFNNGSAQTPDYTITLDKDYYLLLEGVVAPSEIEDINNPEPTVEKVARTITVAYSGSSLYLYWWTGGASWPGEQMTVADGKFVYTFDKSLDGATVNMIFNNNGGGQTADIENIVLDKDYHFTLNADWSYTIDDMTIDE